MNRPGATTPEAKSSSRKREPLLCKLRGSKSVRAITGAAALSVMLTVASCAGQTGAPGPEGQARTESPVVGTGSASPEALVAAGDDYELKFGTALLSDDPEREAVMEQVSLEMARTIVEYMAAEGKSSVQEAPPEAGRTWTMTNGDSPTSDEVQDGPPISMSVMAPWASNVLNNKPSLRFYVGVTSEYAHIRDPGLLAVNLDIEEGREGNLPLPASGADLSAFAEWLGSPEAAEALDPQFIEPPDQYNLFGGSASEDPEVVSGSGSEYDAAGTGSSCNGSPEEILELQYGYINAGDYEAAYDLFAGQSKALIPPDRYRAFFEENAPYSVTDYSFPSVDVRGEAATVGVSFTLSDNDGQERAAVTQELVCEGGAWRVVMRDAQVEAFTEAG